MKTRFILIAFLALCTLEAHAHIGSPDVFFDGKVGSWLAQITIRMPGVVPGRAQIITQVQTKEPVSVFFTPLASKIAISNAPPPEVGQLVTGETNLYTGDLWLMTDGAYSIQVRIHGQSGDGTVLIPVNSFATRQLPLPSFLGKILAALGVFLFCAGMVIVAAAAGESTIAPLESSVALNRRKYWIAFAVTGIVLAAAVIGGKKWWDSEEGDFRSRLREGGWPDLTSEVRVEGSSRILRLNLGKADFDPNDNLGLTLDHGKLLHLFVLALPNHQAMAHIHPVRIDDKTFDVPLPPLPAGDYELFCDATFDTGYSSTATNVVHLPAPPAKFSSPTDPDDSWVLDSSNAARENPAGDTACRLSNGAQIVWKAHPVLSADHDAGFRFQILDSSGHPANLRPYMGMTAHAAVARADGQVFAHLHPSGNFSMAAQMFFDDKMTTETGVHPSMTMMAEAPASTISIPYEFPTSGAYRIWVQVKTGDKIQTGIFDASVN